MWENEDNFIRFEMPSSTESYWENTIYMGANVVGRFLHSCVHSFEVDIAWLRLERKGNRFTGYVSSDGDNWYSCGWVDMNVEDPMNVGIHALCPISPATSTKFEYVKIYRPNG